MMPPPGSWSLVALLVWSLGYTLAQSDTGQVVTIITTSTATALSECTCTQTFSRPLTKHEISTISRTEITTVSSEKSADPTSGSTTGRETDLPSTQYTLSVCPTRITNPTYTPLSPLPTDYTWGCPPRHLCHPDRKTQNGECNFEAGPPADTYYCSPEQCIPSPFLLPPQFWGEPVLSDQVGYFRVSPGYFNLNPHEFGLNYDIFLPPDSSKSSKRELSIRIPGKCYDECNDAMLEAESSGKTPDLCEVDSAFLTLVRSCQSCVASVDLPRISTSTLPQFQQFLYYCEGTGNLSSATSFSSTSIMLTATTLPPVKSTSSILKAAPTITSAVLTATTTESTKTTTTSNTATRAASASIASSMVLPFSTTGTCSIINPIERPTGMTTDAVTSTRKKGSSASPSISLISHPVLTGDGSLLSLRSGFYFIPLLFVFFIGI